MIQHEISLHINRPVEQVFAYVTDSSKLKDWQENLEVLEHLTRGPLRMGSQFREVRTISGRKVDSTAQVVRLEPNKRFETRTTTKPEVSVSYAFAPEEGGTRIIYNFRMNVAGTMKLLQPMIARGIKLQQDADLARLQSILEAQSV